MRIQIVILGFLKVNKPHDVVHPIPADLESDYQLLPS